MADATTAARERIDQALALLERRINVLKASSVTPDDDLFAVLPPASGLAEDKARIAELEGAGRAASLALAHAADAVREILAQTEPDTESAD